MSRSQRRLIAARDDGRRRAAVVSRAVTLGATALAAVFGVAFAQHATAVAQPRTTTPPQTTPHSATTTTPRHTATTTPVSPAPTHTRTTVLQPPAQPPAPAQSNGGGTASSGGT